MLEIKRDQLKEHARSINSLLQVVLKASHSGPFVKEYEGGISLVGWSDLTREVTTDWGQVEVVLRLPVPDVERPRYWISLHEQWQHTGKRQVRFSECGLRIYQGEANDTLLQFLRLEWVAPVESEDAPLAYDGKHAGHPHWHIDRTWLIEAELAAALAAPEAQPIVETFSENTATTRRSIYDSSWLQTMHLPAQANWMNERWDGSDLPGPHQCQPDSLKALGFWWAGALWYLIAELPRLSR
jgi:hypothetical protein